MAENRAAPHTVATVRLLRHFAEKEAQRRFAEARTRLEHSRLREAQAVIELRLAQQVLRARKERQDRVLMIVNNAGPRAGYPQAVALTAQQLWHLQESVQRQRQEVSTLVERQREEAQGLALAGRQADDARERWLLTIARREAVELHEARDRRERARGRARKVAAQEEEAIQRRRT